MSVDRAALVENRVRERVWAICKAVPPIDPEAQFWLDSDASPSYCRKCAVKARAAEFGLGPPLRDADLWSAHTELETAFYEGIDGGFDVHSDNVEACATCGRTLSYILTDEGVDLEVNYYCEAPLTAVRAEDSYALDRLALNVWRGDRKRLLGISIAVNQAYRLITQQGNADAPTPNPENPDAK